MFHTQNGVLRIKSLTALGADHYGQIVSFLLHLAREHASKKLTCKLQSGVFVCLFVNIPVLESERLPV